LKKICASCVRIGAVVLLPVLILAIVVVLEEAGVEDGGEWTLLVFSVALSMTGFAIAGWNSAQNNSESIRDLGLTTAGALIAGLALILQVLTVDPAAWLVVFTLLLIVAVLAGYVSGLTRRLATLQTSCTCGSSSPTTTGSCGPGCGCCSSANRT
jgi:peptidoglycan/LPS O-acetylase OafA/YrhL